MNKISDALIVTEDGTLELGDDIDNIVYHQNLNVLIVTTKKKGIRVFDPHSSQQLSDISLNYDGNNRIQCIYIAKSGALLVCGGENVGLRQDHQGVLLLNTILQTQVTSPDDNVTVEILLSEALQLQQSFSDVRNIENASEVKEALAQAIAASSMQGGSSPKIGKWRTVCLTLSLGSLRSVCSNLVIELRRFSLFVPALSLASALSHRLNHLLGPASPEGTEGDKESMFSESVRLATFSKWPHMDYKWALPEQMAQAGFFHQPTSDDDRAMCFICNICLVYWEPTDEPWSEHERHAPNCPFVKGEYTHNVPLSITYATSPALKHSERSESVHCLSAANNTPFIATGTLQGSITVWNVSKNLKREVCFAIDPSDSIILDKHFSDTVGYTDIPLSPKEAWVENAFSSSSSSSPTCKASPKYASYLLEDLPSTSVTTNGSQNASSLQSKIFGPYYAKSVPADLTDSDKGPSDGTALDSQEVSNDISDTSNSSDLADAVLASLNSNIKENSAHSFSNTFPLEEELFAPPRPSHDVRVSSLNIFGDPNDAVSLSNAGSTKKSQRTCLVVGVGLRRYELFGPNTEFHDASDGLVKVMNHVNQNKTPVPKCLDIMKLELSDLETSNDSLEENNAREDSTLSSSSLGPSFSSSKTFVPYLLVYDLSYLAQKNVLPTKSTAKVSNHGGGKKSTSKVLFSTHSAFTSPKVKSGSSTVNLSGDLNCFLKSKDGTPGGQGDKDQSDAKKIPKCIQCIPLPHKLNSVKLWLHVKHILTSPCGSYLLVCLHRYEPLPANSESRTVGSNSSVVGGILLYRILSSEESLTLQEKPTVVRLFSNENEIPKEIVMIPDLGRDEDSLESGLAGCICNDGTLRILSLNSLEYVYRLPPEDRVFNNLIYCHSLERLCVTSENGKVILVQVKRDDEYSEDPDDTMHTMNVISALCEVNSAAGEDDACESLSNTSFLFNSKDFEVKAYDLLVNKGTSEENLDKCAQLTNFQSGCPRFFATVPPCWSEMIQAQKQRRNPQHLQHQSEDVETTRTWRLEADSTTYDEHLFYLLLSPGAIGSPSVQVGHIDVKLNFLPFAPLPLPKIQVTLLKQNHKNTRKTPFKVPDTSLEFPENPVLTKDFLLVHKAEILCGPVTVNQHLDLSGQAANITLASPSLLACGGRSYIIHIKAIPPVSQLHPHMQESPCSELRLIDQYVPPQGSTFLDKLSPSLLKRTEAAKGCDVIHELSFTIYCCAKTSIPLERIQRLAIIEKKSFHQELVEAVINPSSSDHVKQRSLDLLLWILSIHISANDLNNHGTEIVLMIQKCLSQLVRASLLQGDRSIAHKAAKILIMSLESIEKENQRESFAQELLTSLLQWLDQIVSCQSAGALCWFFSLLNHVKWVNPIQTAAKVTKLLSITSEMVYKKMDPLHSILQTKFNLFGTPFEREIFDTFPPLLAKQNTGNANNQTSSGPSQSTSSSSNNNNNNNNTNNNTFYINNNNNNSQYWSKYDPMFGMTLYNKPQMNSSLISRDGHDLGLVFGQSGITSGLTPQIGSLCGLLEVEPLHFSLHMASDGTKMERVFPGWNCTPNPFSVQPYNLAVTSEADGNANLDISKNSDTSMDLLSKALEDMEDLVTKNQNLEFLLAKKATKKLQKLNSQLTVAKHLQNLDNQLADAMQCLQKQKKKLLKVSSENSALTSQEEQQNATNGPNKTETNLLTEGTSSSTTTTTTSPDTSPELDTFPQAIKEVSSGDAPNSNSNNKVVQMLIDKILDYNGTLVNSEVSFEDKYLKSKGDENETTVNSPDSQDTPTPLKEEEKAAVTTNAKSEPGGAAPPYQQLLSLPPQQMLVIERMHSGARRFIVLDFGAPVVLTDLIIPACNDLVSLTIDIWLTGEETDGERLAVASDIGIRPLVLADLQPPPLCRYLKVTTLGRYGMMASQCRIPIGAFYGHTVILPWYLQPYQPSVNVISKQAAQAQLAILTSMLEDVGCRYSLACSKLRGLLQPLKKTSTSFVAPSFVGTNENQNSASTDLERKIKCSYQECILEQQHLNLILAVVRRLQKFIGIRDGPPNTLSSFNDQDGSPFDLASHKEMLWTSDKLASLMQYLLNSLLTLSLPPPNSQVPMNLIDWCGPSQAQALVEHVCIRGPRGAQVAVVSVLARLCATKPWWGNFLSSTIVSLFSSGQSSNFPATRVFSLLTFLGQKSVQCGRGSHVIDAILQSLLLHMRNARVIEEPLDSDPGSDWLGNQDQSHLDVQLMSWLLLFLSLCLDSLASPSRTSDNDKANKDNGRWVWLSAETCLFKKVAEPTKGAPKSMRERLRKRLVHHKQQLVNLETATKSFGEVLAGLGTSVNPKMVKQSEQVFKKIQNQHALKHFKDLCSIRRHESNSLRRGCKAPNNPATVTSAPGRHPARDDTLENLEACSPVERASSLAVSQGLISLLMSASFPSTIDLFLLSCKVLGGLVRVTRPCLKISEILSGAQLEALLCHTLSLDCSWGTPWALHALTCFLQDVIYGERLYGSIILNSQPAEEEMGNSYSHWHAPVNDSNSASEFPQGITDDSSSSSSLHISVLGENEENVLNLIRNGAPINARDDNGFTPLHLAVSRNLKAMAEILLKNGANVNEKDQNGRTPLFYASKDAALMLISNGANVNEKDEAGYTPLHHSIMSSSKENLSLLIDNGANVNAMSVTGDCPLHLAVCQVQESVVETLIKSGANVNEKNSDGQTPLHLAMLENQSKIELLLKHKAKVSIRDSKGKTPLHLAKARDQNAIVELMAKSLEEEKESKNTLKTTAASQPAANAPAPAIPEGEKTTDHKACTDSESTTAKQKEETTSSNGSGFLVPVVYTEEAEDDKEQAEKIKEAFETTVASAGVPVETAVQIKHDELTDQILGNIPYLDSEDSSESEDDFLDMHFHLSPTQKNTALKSLGLEDPFYCMVNQWEPTSSTTAKNGKDTRINELITAPLASQKPKTEADHSTAIDARLENGVSLTAEVRLHMMNAIHSSRLSLAVSEPLKVTSRTWNSVEMYGPGNLSSSIELLAQVFQNALSHLASKTNKNELESVLELWLNLNTELCAGESGSGCLIPLSKEGLSLLLSTVHRSPSVSIRCWSLLLQMLTLYTKANSIDSSISTSESSHHTNSEEYDDTGYVCRAPLAILSDRNFLPVLQKFLSGNCGVGSDSRLDMVGGTLTNHLEEFLMRLQSRCDIANSESQAGNKLKLGLLTLVLRMLEPNGPLTLGVGPLDAQRSLLNILLSMQYEGLHRSPVPRMIINSIASLVKDYLSSFENEEDCEQSASMLGGLFVSVLGSDGRHGPAPSRRILLCSLLNLARKLVEIPLSPPQQATPPHSREEYPGSSPSVPLTDALKLEQQRCDLGPSIGSSQTDEHKALRSPGVVGASAAPEVLCKHCTPSTTAYLADSVLQNSETMQLLLQSLGLCEGNSFMMILGAVSGDVSEKLSLGETLTDALYKLLFFLNLKVTKPELLIDPLIRYISPSGIWYQPPLSEAIFCFFTQILDCDFLLKKFAEKGGLKLLWSNLVNSVGKVGAGRGGLVTAVMNHLSPPLPPSNMGTSNTKRSEPLENSSSMYNSSNATAAASKKCEAETSGLYNFAPLAIITSSNPTARPADALVQSSQFFQRTKAPPWSYHFYPYENWVDLNLSLPCPILLHEVHLQPHTLSLGMCPSAVSVEAGVEGSSLIPVTGMIDSAGLTYVRIILPRPVVASIIVVRLNRPKDQTTLGLSQLKLLGNTTFKEAARVANEPTAPENLPRRSSLWWLRLIHHCMYVMPAGMELGVEAGASVPKVMEACVTLLLTPSNQQQHSTSSALEATALALANTNQRLLHTLVKCLLSHPLLLQPVGSSSVEAAIALLYELCINNSSTEGAKLLLSWLNRLMDDNLGGDRNLSTPTVNHEILMCIASVLWNIPHDIASLLTDDLFRKIFLWCERASGEIKEGLDHILCSICYIQPHYFTQLLIRMGILTVIDCSITSITDDRKDREAEIRASCTDDMKEGVAGCGVPGEGRLILQDPSVISLTPSSLQTLGMAARAHTSIHILLDSGFPLLLVHGILEWCKAELLHQVESCTSPNAGESATDIEKASAAELSSHCPELSTSSAAPPPQISASIVPTLSASMVAQTLETLAALSSEPTMKDWLGSGEGSVFWLPLLTVLGDPVVRGSEISLRSLNGGIEWERDADYSRVEDATIHLMKQCAHCHPHNQEMLSSTLCHLIQRQNAPPPGGLTYLHSLSGFTRRLVLQILLDTERVLLHVTTSTGSLSNPPANTIPHQAHHPKFGAGHKTRLFHLPTSTRIEDIIKMVTDWWQSPLSTTTGTNPDAGDNSDDGSQKRELGEVGLELVDKLSVAAGVTAKDKRNKDKANFGFRMQSKQGKKVEVTKDKELRPKKGGGPFAAGSIISSPSSSYGLVHEDILNGAVCLPSELTLAQVMAAAKQGASFSAGSAFSHLSLKLIQRKDNAKENRANPEFISLTSIEPLPSTLHVFTSQGGLSILAQHMALLYPDTSHQVVTSVSKHLNDDNKVIDMNMEDDFVGFQVNDIMLELNQTGFGSSPGMVRGSPINLLSISPIPPHALGAFTLFLRLPGFAETLLTDTNKACCLLRLALGVNPASDEGDYGLQGAFGSLATLPFQVLEMLLKSTPLTTDDGRLLRQTCLSAGALHLILACLAALSHQDSPEVLSSLTHPNVPVGLVVATARSSCAEQREPGQGTHGENDRCHYWAKGTGFGTGSTIQSWNVEQALNRQKMEEQHVVWLIRLLAQYINPGDSLPPNILKSVATSWAMDSLLQDNCKSLDTLTSPSSTSTSDPSSPSRASEKDLPAIPEDGAQGQAKQPTPEAKDAAESLSDSQEDPSTQASALPSEVFELFLNSGLISKIASYLNNDSVLDMSRHVPLYRALLALVRGIAVTPLLTPLLTKLKTAPRADSSSSSSSSSSGSSSGKETLLQSPSHDLPSLLQKMMFTVNTYMIKLKWKANKGTPTSSAKGTGGDGGDKPDESEGTLLEEESDEGLSLLVPDIQVTSNIVQVSMERFLQQTLKEKGSLSQEGAASQKEDERSFLDIYLSAMKPLQFDSFEMIVEDADGEIRFVVPYHYEKSIKNSGTNCHPRRVKRLAQEAVTLSTSLPLSYSSSVFVRTDMDRLDVMKVLITGPEDTPYANGCFEFDVHFPVDYPNSPLFINLQTTGEKKVRFNPNLYMDGKVCLSILNTWHGRPEEKWNPQTSSLLQVLVSIQSLILVSEPYFNEPGYERSRGTPFALHNSQEYDANIRTATVRWAILNQLKNHSPCFKDVVERHFWLKQKDILVQVETWIAEMDALSESKRVGRVISHHVVALKKLYQLLKNEFSKMTPPKGLENVSLPNVSAKAPSEAVKARLEAQGRASAYATARRRKTSRANLMDSKTPNVVTGEPKNKASSPTPTPASPSSSGASKEESGGGASVSASASSPQVLTKMKEQFELMDLSLGLKGDESTLAASAMNDAVYFDLIEKELDALPNGHTDSTSSESLLPLDQKANLGSALPSGSHGAPAASSGGGGGAGGGVVASTITTSNSDGSDSFPTDSFESSSSSPVMNGGADLNKHFEDDDESLCSDNNQADNVEVW